MNKTELKKFAVEARRDLIRKVSLKAEQYGITKENPYLDMKEKFGQLVVNGKNHSPHTSQALNTMKQRLISIGYEQLIEEVAYTWFNRIIAIFYMEINGYLPEKVNILSSSTGKREPDILEQYETILSVEETEKINDLLKKDDIEKGYRAIFIAICSSLNDVIPNLFEKEKGYIELLLPDYLLDNEFIIKKLINNRELASCFEEVEVIGWLYQYYNIDKKTKIWWIL